MIFDSNACKKLHNRNISVTTYAYQENTIAIEGRLTDNRYRDSYNLFGEVRPAGTVHDMIIQMIIRLPKMIIEDVAVNMVTVPNPDCREALSSLLPLKGERITAGFTSKVQQLVGGVQGCAHLLALSRAMASAAIQGAYTAASGKPPERDSYAVRSLNAVVDTCHIWRSDGPLVKRVREMIETS